MGYLSTEGVRAVQKYALGFLMKDEGFESPLIFLFQPNHEVELGRHEEAKKLLYVEYELVVELVDETHVEELVVLQQLEAQGQLMKMILLESLR